MHLGQQRGEVDFLDFFRIRKMIFPINNVSQMCHIVMSKYQSNAIFQNVSDTSVYFLHYYWKKFIFIIASIRALFRFLFEPAKYLL